VALYLSEDDVKAVLTMPLALEAVTVAHQELSREDALVAQDTPRARTRLPQTALHLLQGGLPGLGILGYKAYTSNRSGNRFNVFLFDAATGILEAVVSADFLGMMRTGAASGVAAKWLARPESEVAGVFGTGWQARGHVEAICTALPLRRVQVYGRKREKLEAFCAEMGERLKGVEIVPAESPEATVRGADIIGTVTTAAQPVFEADWLTPGVHINAAGSNAIIRQELSEATVRRCDLVVVDTVETALKEAGDLLPLLEKGRLSIRQLVELGDVMVGRRPGRTGPEQITLFESQGLAVQDLALAARVVALARERGLGQELPFGS
jgi:ornithine cyclodeaminase